MRARGNNPAIQMDEAPRSSRVTLLKILFHRLLGGADDLAHKVDQTTEAVGVMLRVGHLGQSIYHRLQSTDVSAVAYDPVSDCDRQLLNFGLNRTQLQLLCPSHKIGSQVQRVVTDLVNVLLSNPRPVRAIYPFGDLEELAHGVYQLYRGDRFLVAGHRPMFCIGFHERSASALEPVGQLIQRRDVVHAAICLYIGCVMSLYYDLHTHTYHSDGLLAPAELVKRAHGAGLRTLALTDHDGIAGLAEAAVAAAECGLNFVPGIELSVTWGGQTIHVVGLGVDAGNEGLRGGIQMLQERRDQRARAIDAQLTVRGIKGMYEGARAHARGILGRLHFARALVMVGAARDARHAFSEFLGQGRCAYVRTEWASLGDAVGWITAAGGLAVIAHPARYRLSAGALQRLLTEFREAGGSALEVVSSSHSDEEMRRFALLATHNDLLASAGSDFHAPGESRLDVGCLPELPPGCTPLWSIWEQQAGKMEPVGV